MEIKKEKMLYDYLLAFKHNGSDCHWFRTRHRKIRTKDIDGIVKDIQEHYESDSVVIFNNIVLLDVYPESEEE